MKCLKCGAGGTSSCRCSASSVGEKHVDAQSGQESSSLLGRTFGHVKLEKKIGSGGMGEVYQGRHMILHTPMAVKILHRRFANNTKILERFRREALAISSLQHDHVVKVMDFGWEDDIGAYLIMECLKGHSLSRSIALERPFSAETFFHVARQLSSVLKSAHQHGILHRDLKPDNIFMCCGDSIQVKVLDFGIAWILEESDHMKLTRAGVPLGTPYYMAPEQARGDWQNVDHRADIFSFAVILYEMYAGRTPVEKGKTFEVLERQSKGEWQSLSHHCPELRGYYFEHVIGWGMAFDRDHRPSSIDNFIQELEAAIWSLPQEGSSLVVSNHQSVTAQRSGDIPFSSEDISNKNNFSKTSIVSSLSSDHIFSTQFSFFENLSPLLFRKDKLRGTASLGKRGEVIKSSESFPPVCLQALHPLEGVLFQLVSTLPLGEWQYGMLETNEHILGMFPHLDGLGAMLFDQGHQAPTMSLDSFLRISPTPLVSNEQNQQPEPLKAIQSFRGVSSAFLFSVDGKLIQSLSVEQDLVRDIERSLQPVFSVIMSLPFLVKGLDIQFEFSRLLVWDLNGGVLFALTNQDVNKLMLSAVVGSQISSLLEKCSVRENSFSSVYGWMKEVYGAKNLPAIVASSVEEPQSKESYVPVELFKVIEKEYILYIGPMASKVIKKMAKSFGFPKKKFPRSGLSKFVQLLAAKLEKSKRKDFIEGCMTAVHQELKGGE